MIIAQWKLADLAICQGIHVGGDFKEVLTCSKSIASVPIHQTSPLVLTLKPLPSTSRKEWGVRVWKQRSAVYQTHSMVIDWDIFTPNVG